MLHEKGLISEKKYQHLNRSTAFTEDELAGFIARQLVETRQSTKVVAQLLKEYFPETEIVYVKAGLVSEFRQEMNMVKCREVNDLHHAKDAYLNIVVGNVYNVRFTHNPIHFVRKNPNYSIKLFKKNQGGFFNQNPERKKEGLIPRKKGLDTEKYGGYNKATASFFSIIKVKDDIVFIPVDLLVAEKYINDNNAACEIALKALSEFYAKKKLAKITTADISFPFSRKVLKINTLIEVDGFRMNIRSKDSGGTYILVSSAVPFIPDDEHYSYIKKLESFKKKHEENKGYQVTKYSGITSERNIELYKYLAKKCQSEPFKRWKKFNEAGEILENGLHLFEKESAELQALNLMKILFVLKTGRSENCDLKFAGGVVNFNTARMNSVLDSKKHPKIYIIDQSPTGLIEKKSANLLTL